MADNKFHIGDSVWFKYDNGRKEQKGIIQMVSDCHLYYILGKVTHECYSVKEEDISSIAPHLRQTKYQVDTWVYFKGPDKQYFQGLIKDYDYGDHLYKIEYLRDGYTRNGYVFEREILDFKFKNGEEIEFRYNVKWQRGKIQQCYADKDGQIFYDIYPWDEMIKAYSSLRGYKEIPEMNVRPHIEYDKIPWECKDSVPVSTDGVYLKELVPPLQPKFKVGDKVIFQDRFGHSPLYGTIIEITNNHWEPYRIKEKDKPDIWDVSEYEITGVWDECTIPMPTDHLDYFRYFPTFSFPTVSDAVVRIDTDSIKVKKEDNMNNRPRNHKFVKVITKERRIKEVMFNGPATIIKWEPTMHDYAYGKTKGDKTVSVCGVTDPYDKEKGFLLAVIKEFVDNQSYDNILRMMDSFNDEERK